MGVFIRLRNVTIVGFLLFNKAIMDPSTQQFFFSSSDVIATTCFGHTTIIKRYAVVYYLKLFA
jgi:hypothetical protein